MKQELKKLLCQRERKLAIDVRKSSSTDEMSHLISACSRQIKILKESIKHWKEW